MKKLLVMLLAIALMLTVFSGCQKTEDKDVSTTKEAVATEKKAGETAEATAAPEEEKPVLNFLGRDTTFDLAEEPMIPILEEKTGYVVEFEALPAGEEGTNKLMLLLSSGESYDMIISYPAHFDRAYAANALMELNDLVTAAPNLLSAVPASSKTWERTTVDGVIYGIPQQLPTGGPIDNTIVVRQDLLDEQGLAMPTTTDELYNVLVALKAAYPDMIPLSTQAISSSGYNSGTIQSAFGLYEDWKDVNGTLLPVQKRPEMKEFIAYMRKLYEEGLLDEEFPANTQGTKNEKFASGVAAMVNYAWWEAPGFYAAVKEGIPDATTAYMPFLKDAKGNSGVMVRVGLEKVACIPKSAVYPEDAIQWVDKFMENFKEIYIGIEGVDHEIVDGGYTPILPEFNVHNDVWWFLPAVDEANAVDYWQARVRKNADLIVGYLDTSALKDGINVVQPYFELSPPIEEMVEYSAFVDQYWVDEMTKIIVGAQPMEYYDEVVAKWEADGGAAIIESANANK